MVRKIIVGFVAATGLLAVCAAAWLWFSPPHTLSQIHAAAEQGSAAQLSEYVDFESLKASMKGQLNVIVLQDSNTRLRDNPFGGLGALLAMKLADTMVDAFVSPAGLQAMLEGRRFGPGEKGPNDATAESNQPRPRRPEYDISRDGFSWFTATLKLDEGDTVEYRFKRYGFGWKLAEIKLPKKLLEPGLVAASPETKPDVPTVPPKPESAPAMPAAIPTNPEWEISESTHPMDDSPIVTILLSADEKIKTRWESRTPRLVLRCKERRLDAYITTSSLEREYGRDDHGVRLRFDTSPAKSERWNPSTDREALFSPKPRRLIKEILASQSMLFEFTPFGSGAVQARFSVAGLDKHVEKLRQGCQPKETSRSRPPVKASAKTAADTTKPKDQQYSLHVITLSDAEKAKQMQQQISAAGIKSYIEVIKTSRGDVTRVRAGPFASRETAEKARDQLKEIGLDGKLIPH